MNTVSRPRISLMSLIFLLSVPAVPAIPVVAAERMARLVIPEQPTRIDGIKWERDDLEVRHEQREAEITLTVLLEGKYCKKDGISVAQAANGPSRKIKVGSDCAFSQELPITGQTTSVTLTAIDPLGKVETQKIGILLEEYEQIQKRFLESKSKRSFSSPSLGFTWLRYSETGMNPYSGLLLTAKVSYSYLIVPPAWEIGANAYINMFPLVSNQDVTIRFLGLNLRGGYVVPRIQDPWRLSLSGGLFISSMFVSGGSFGYTPLVFPQVVPAFRYRLANRSSISGYLKYVPLSQGFSPISLSEREPAFGVGWVKPYLNGRSLGINLDFSDMRFDLSARRRLELQTYSLSASFTL